MRGGVAKICFPTAQMLRWNLSVEQVDFTNFGKFSCGKEVLI